MALTEVAENSLFSFAGNSDVAAFETAAPDTGCDWLRACVRFSGPIGGQLSLTAPATLVRRLAASFAGADTADDIGDGDLADFAGELANMVCGAWLTRACGREPFALAPPRVFPGQRLGADAGPGGTNPGVFYLALDDTPIRLEIDWGVARPAAVGAMPECTDAR